MFSPQSSLETFEDSDASYVQFINLDPPLPSTPPQIPNSSYLGRSLAKTKLIIKRENAKQRILMKKEARKEYERNFDDNPSLIPTEKNLFSCDLTQLNKSEVNTSNDTFLLNKEVSMSNGRKTQKISERTSKLPGKAKSDEEGRNEVEKERKKVIQKIRNRVSAQMSRDRKKIYLDGLEKENRQLKERIALLENSQRSVKTEETKILSVNNSHIFNASVIRFSFMMITMVFLMFTVKKGEKIEGFNSKGLLDFLNAKPFENLEKIKDLLDQDQNQFHEIAQKIKMEPQIEEIIWSEQYIYIIFFLVFI